MSVTFNPKHKYVVWPDYTGQHGQLVKADAIEVTEGGALVFSSIGNDGVSYITQVQSPAYYAYFGWYGDNLVGSNEIVSAPAHQK
jgi:hypothetical protein